jgi:hypothetical protein
VQKVRDGESMDDCAARIENDTIMETGIFRTNCMPFVNACEKHGVEGVYFVDLPSTVRNVVPLYLDDQYGDQITRTRLMSLRLQEVRAVLPGSKTIVMFVDQLLMMNIYENLLEWRHDNRPETYEAIKWGLYDSLALVLANHLTDRPIPGTERYEKSGQAPEDLFDQWTDDYLKIVDHALEQNRGGGRVDNETVQAGTSLSEELFRLCFEMYKVSAPRRNDISCGSADYMTRLRRERRKLCDMLLDGSLRAAFRAASERMRL